MIPAMSNFHRQKLEISVAALQKFHRQCMVITGSVKRPWSLHVAWGFGLWGIERSDRHLCHVTGSDHT